MSILWCGGEDTDFSAGAFQPTGATAGGEFRPAFSRCCIPPTTGTTNALSNPFHGGAITSCWFSFQIYTATPSTSRKLFGLAKSGTNAQLLIIASAASSTRVALAKWDGTTLTQLAAETGNSLTINTLMKFDVQLVNYGATAVVNVFLNAVLLLTFSGDVTVLSNTSLDQVVIPGANGSFISAFSEVIVADEDTRGFPGLMTLALTGAGTTDNWSGLFSTINQVALSDTTPNFSNTAAQDQQFNVTDLTSGTFVIKAVKITARAAKAAGTATQIKLGYNSGGTVAFNGSNLAITTAYATYEQLDATNPITGVAWVQTDMNALQLDVRSA